MGMYFTIGELCKSDTAARSGIKNEPTAAIKVNLNKLIDNILDPLRCAYRKPIYVNSGYRCPRLNVLVGGAKNSEHQYGRAADITAGSKSENKKLFDLVIKLGLEFNQLISESDYSWIHVSYNEDFNRGEVLHL